MFYFRAKSDQSHKMLNHLRFYLVFWLPKCRLVLSIFKFYMDKVFGLCSEKLGLGIIYKVSGANRIRETQ